MVKFLLPALLLLAPRQDPAIDRLIERLASDSVEEREEAEKALVERGREAEAALRKAADAGDAERAARAAAALRRIAERREESDWLERVRSLPATTPELLWKGNSGEASVGTLRTTTEDGLLVFDDRIDGKDDDGPVSYHCRAVCAADRSLTLRSLKAEKGRDGKVLESCDLELRDGLLLPRGVPGRPAGDGRPFEHPVVTWYGLLRLFGVLPQREGFSLTLDVVTFGGAITTTPAQTVTCKGEETVTLDGKSRRVWVWECSKVAFWVQDRRVCRMAYLGQWEILFSVPKR